MSELEEENVEEQLEDGEEEKFNANERFIVSLTNYEGGLLGLSASDVPSFDDLATEFAFKAQDNSISIAASYGRLLALGGY